jgi:hypothetical protein
LKNENPFERFALDPREGIASITARLRELAEDATNEHERAEIRAVWEELTLHPARRLRAAVGAHPETRPPLGSPPPPLPTTSARLLTFRDLALRPSVAMALATRADAPRAHEETSASLPLAIDPHLQASNAPEKP